MRAFYNEIDRYCCDWLQNLMDAGLITPGRIDDRSIEELGPDDLRGYERAHFFAGIAGWELALQMSEYDGPVWTGSCPCQPFSAAGKGKASSDERHLWPAWFRLIKACRPPRIFGEQVEAAIGWGWLDLICSDLEAEGYTVGAAVLPACSVGAPHIRQRLWFVADSISERQRGADRPQGEGIRDSTKQRGGKQRLKPSNGGTSGYDSPWDNLIWLPCTDGKQRPTGIVDNPDTEGPQGQGSKSGECASERPSGPPSSTDGKQRPTGLLANAEIRTSVSAQDASPEERRRATKFGVAGEICGPDEGSTQSIIQPLAHGVPKRVAKLRAIGNAIVPQVAAEFIKASMK